MSVLAWAEPPAAEAKAVAKTKLRVVYELPDFGATTPGEIPDLRWARELGRNNRHKGAITRALGEWLEENPGYWALVGTYGTVKGYKACTSGWPTDSLYSLDILHSLRDGKVYAHSSVVANGMTAAESLSVALDGHNGAHGAVLSLPKLTKDSFGWTEAELTSAVAMARDWLYPTEELVA